MNFIKPFKAFTLVELIVVITILAILATIGFTSFIGYTLSSRESTRLSDVKLIEKQLSLYEVQNDTIPLPDNAVTITASGTTIGYQGEVGTGVLVSLRQAGDIKDPLDATRYSYFVDTARQNYQIMAMMENETSLRTSFMPETYANVDYSERYPRVFGSELGIMTDENNTPLTSTTGSTIELLSNNNVYISYLTDDSKFRGSGGEILSSLTLGNTDLYEGIYPYDSNLITYIDPNLGDKNLKSSVQYERLGGVSIVEESNNNKLVCDGSSSSRIRLSSGEKILGGEDEFSLYVSFEIEEGKNGGSSDKLFASYGISSGYNLVCQGNLSVETPSFYCWVRNNDNGTLSSYGTSIPISYDTTQEILITMKDNMIYFYKNGELINQSVTQGVIHDTSTAGLGFCARPGGGYALSATINNIYISKVGIAPENVNYFFEKIKK